MAQPIIIPPPTPSSDPEITAAHQLIYDAYVAHRIHLGMKGALNSRRSPVHNKWENLLPYALIAFLIITYTYQMGLQGLILSGSLGLGVGAFVVPRWVMNKVRRRTMIMAFTSGDGWDALWRIGGLSIRLDEDPDVVCDSPGGDWKAFARQHFGAERA
jgi:hypothetical protein